MLGFPRAADLFGIVDGDEGLVSSGQEVSFFETPGSRLETGTIPRGEVSFGYWGLCDLHPHWQAEAFPLDMCICLCTEYIIDISII